MRILAVVPELVGLGGVGGDDRAFPRSVDHHVRGPQCVSLWDFAPSAELAIARSSLSRANGNDHLDRRKRRKTPTERERKMRATRDHNAALESMDMEHLGRRDGREHGRGISPLPQSIRAVQRAPAPLHDGWIGAESGGESAVVERDRAPHEAGDAVLPDR
jgi:hypothetical protein